MRTSTCIIHMTSETKFKHNEPCKPCQHQTARRNRYQHCHRGSVEGEVSTIACVIPWNVNMRFHPQHMQAMPASDSPSQSVSTLPQGAQWKEKSVQLLVSSLGMSTCDSTRNTCKPCQHQTARRNRYQHCHKGLSERRSQYNCLCHPLECQHAIPPAAHASHASIRQPVAIGINTATGAQWKEKSVQLLVSSLGMSTCDSTRNTCKPCQHQTARRNLYQHCHKGLSRRRSQYNCLCHPLECQHAIPPAAHASHASIRQPVAIGINTATSGSVEGEVSTIACVIPWNVNMRFHPQHMQAMPASDSPSQSVSTLPQGLSGRRSQYNCLCHPLECQHAIPPATHASHASIRQPVAIGINTATSGSVEGEVSTIACVIPWNVNMRFHPQHMQAMPASDSPSQSVSTLPQGLSGRRSQYNCLCHPLECQHAIPPATHASHASIRQPVAIGINTATSGSVEGEVSTIACVIPWNVNMRFHPQHMQAMPASDSPSQSVSTLPQVAQWKEKSVQLLVSSLGMSTCNSTRNTCKPCQHQTARRNRYQHCHRGSVEGEVSTIACVIPRNVHMRFHPQHMQAMPASDSPSQSVSTLPQGLSGRRSQYNCLCHPLECQHAIPPATHASHASMRQPFTIRRRLQSSL